MDMKKEFIYFTNKQPYIILATSEIRFFSFIKYNSVNFAGVSNFLNLSSQLPALYFSYLDI